MKKLLIITLCLITAFSCQQEDMEIEKSKPTNNTSLRNSANIPSPISQLVGIPFYIELPNGCTIGHNMISAEPKGSGIKMYTHDDGGQRQRWYIENNISGYKIRVEGGQKYGWNYLKAPIPWENNYWPSMDSNSSTLWNFVPVGNTDRYYIEQSRIPYLNQKHYLTVTAHNSKDIKVMSYDGSPRQEWQIKPIESYELIDVTYRLNPGDVVSSIPAFMESVTLNNNTALQQQMTVGFTHKATETSSFSKTTGLSLTISTGSSAKVGLPVVGVDFSINTSVTTSKSWTYGNTESQEDSRTYNFPMVVPPYSSYKADLKVSMTKLSVTYVATYKGLISKREVILTGKWDGVLAGKIDYDIYDAKTNKFLRTINGVPHTAQVIN